MRWEKRQKFIQYFNFILLSLHFRHRKQNLRDEMREILFTFERNPIFSSSFLSMVDWFSLNMVFVAKTKSRMPSEDEKENKRIDEKLCHQHDHNLITFDELIHWHFRISC